MFEDGHNLADFYLHPSIGSERLEVVSVKDFGMNTIKFKLHIFVPIHLSTLVKVLGVQIHEASVGGGKSTV